MFGKNRRCSHDSQLVNVARGLFGEAIQGYRTAKSDLDVAIKEFDQALWDQTRELVLGKIALVYLSPHSRSLSAWLRHPTTGGSDRLAVALVLGVYRAAFESQKSSF